MKIFKPTYLCIKQHTKSGLLYFCKTQKSYEEMLKYNGSGTDWKIHIKENRKEFVETIWYCLFLEQEELTNFALMCSKQWGIVKSKEWANKKLENGLDGCIKGSKQLQETIDKRVAKIKGKPSWNKNLKLIDDKYKVGGRKQKGKVSPNKGKKYGPHTAEKNANNSALNTGRIRGPWSEERKASKSAAMKNLSKIKCPYCPTESRNAGNMRRYHFSNCKLKKGIKCG